MKNNKAYLKNHNPSAPTSTAGDANLQAFFALLYKIDLRNKKAESVDSLPKIIKTGLESRPERNL